MADHGHNYRTWPYSGAGIPIADGDVVVAELIDKNIYILHSLQSPRFRNSANVFRQILDLVVEEREMTPEQRLARREEADRKRREVARAAYVQACAGRFARALNATKESIQRNERRAEQLQTELVKCIREVNGAKQKLQQMQPAESELQVKYGIEFDKLVASPKVIEVKVVSGVVQVFTETLYCIDPRSNLRHEIGKFRIDLNIGGQVRWHNLTRKVNYCHAPHVFKDGEACLGNMEEVMPELMANYEFAAAAMVAIQFVESVNVRDEAGARINEWPVAA